MSDDDYRPHQTIVPVATLLPDTGPEVAGLRQVTPDPALQTIPTDLGDGETQLHVGWPPDDSIREGSDRPPYDHQQPTSPITAHPVPIIGAIPYGSTVMSAGQVTLAVGGTVQLGAQGSVRPQVTQILLVVAGNEVDVMQRVDMLSRGLPLPVNVQPITLNVQQLVLRNNSAGIATVSWLVLGYDVPTP